MRTSVVVALAIAASLGACDGTHAPTRTESSQTDVLNRPFGPSLRPRTETFHRTRAPATVDSPFVRDVLQDGRSRIVWIESPPFVVGQEYPVEDVRDTKRDYHDDVGATIESPIDGTINPAKAKLNAERESTAEALAKRHARLAVEMLRHFQEVFGEPLALPDVATPPIRLLAVWTDATWDRWASRSGASPSGFVEEFVPREDLVVWRFGPTAIGREDEIRCAAGRVQKSADVHLASGLASLFLRRSASHLRHVVADAATAGAPRWLLQGVQEFLSAVEVDETGTESLADVTWFHDRILLERVAQARGHDAAPADTKNARGLSLRWTLEELLRPTARVDCLERGERLAPGQGEFMADLFCARAFGFCHFLWFYDDGKYRSKLRDGLRAALDGTFSDSSLAEIFGRPNDADFRGIEREFEWYWGRLLARKVGKSRVNHVWETPSTDPPVGKVEDDADFCEIWAENHRDAGRK